MKIAYVKEAMVTIKSPDNKTVFMEWSLRQTSLLISRKPAALKLGILLYGSECLLILASVPYMIFFSPFYVIFLLPPFASFMKFSPKNTILLLVEFVRLYDFSKSITYGPVDVFVMFICGFIFMPLPVAAYT